MNDSEPDPRPWTRGEWVFEAIIFAIGVAAAWLFHEPLAILAFSFVYRATRDIGRDDEAAERGL
jgi:hypothetical protein